MLGWKLLRLKDLSQLRKIGFCEADVTKDLHAESLRFWRKEAGEGRLFLKGLYEGEKIRLALLFREELPSSAILIYAQDGKLTEEEELLLETELRAREANYAAVATNQPTGGEAAQTLTKLGFCLRETLPTLPGETAFGQYRRDCVRETARRIFFYPLADSLFVFRLLTEEEVRRKQSGRATGEELTEGEWLWCSGGRWTAEKERAAEEKPAGSGAAAERAAREASSGDNDPSGRIKTPHGRAADRLLPPALAEAVAQGHVPLTATGWPLILASSEFLNYGARATERRLARLAAHYRLLDDRGCWEQRRAEAFRARVLCGEERPEEEALLFVFRALEAYFRKQRRAFDFPLYLEGSDFQRRVWKKLLDIPFADTQTYRALAEAVSAYGAQSSRAVGQACGRNPLPIFLPCHRVLGQKRRLVGFTGGIRNKERLLAFEQMDIPWGHDLRGGQGETAPSSGAKR